MEFVLCYLDLHYLHADSEESLKRRALITIHKALLMSLSAANSKFDEWEGRIKKLPKSLIKDLLCDFEQLFCKHIIEETESIVDSFQANDLEKYVYLLRTMLRLNGVPCEISLTEHFVIFPNKKPCEW